MGGKNQVRSFLRGGKKKPTEAPYLAKKKKIKKTAFLSASQGKKKRDTRRRRTGKKGYL